MKRYTFDIKKYISLINKKENVHINPNQLIDFIIKSYNVEKFIKVDMIYSLLQDKKKYIILNDHFDFAAQFLVYSYLLKIGTDRKSIKFINLKKKIKKSWESIFLN
jgi:hypothetical protein